MTDRLAIWGAGGHGKVALDVAQSMGVYEEIVFLDDDPTWQGMTFGRHRVIGGAEKLNLISDYEFVVAIGDNRTRARCFDRAVGCGLAAASLVHARAVIAPTARIGAGTVVMAGAIVNADAIVGEDCIINTAVVVEHDCTIESHVHLSPGCVLGGGVHVGSLTQVGLGAVVLPAIRIGEEATVGAGAVVLKEVESRCTVAGVPAKVLTYA